MRWKRRRIRRIERAYRKAEAERGAQFIQLYEKREDGEISVKRWKIPHIPLPRGTKVWTVEEVEKHGVPSSPFLMSVYFNATFHRCNLCGLVGQTPDHPKDLCDSRITRQVLES